MTFTQQNTEGYTDAQLAAFNAEAETRIPELMKSHGIDRDQAAKAFSDEIARRPQSLRSVARSLVIAEVSAAIRKGHERNYEKLTVRRDGSVSWFECINRTDNLIDDQADSPSIAAIPSVITVGTGSMGCNCDFCEKVYSQRKEDELVELARNKAAEGEEDAAEAAARAEYQEDAYPNAEDAISDAVANSDTEDTEAAMLEAFDTIANGYFDDEAV